MFVVTEAEAAVIRAVYERNKATRSGVRHGRHGCADHGCVRSINRWKEGKETGDGKIAVTMTLTDPAEGRAWAVSYWIMNPAEFTETGHFLRARRARPRWGQYGSDIFSLLSLANRRRHSWIRTCASLVARPTWTVHRVRTEQSAIRQNGVTA